MSSENIRVDEEPKNIWGLSGCELPSGDLCTACCRVFEIITNHTKFREHYPDGKKPVGRWCELLQNSDEGTPSGCSVHKNPPESCRKYHCNQTKNPAEIARLAASQLNLGKVTIDEADKAMGEFPGKYFYLNGAANKLVSNSKLG